MSCCGNYGRCGSRGGTRYRDSGYDGLTDRRFVGTDRDDYRRGQFVDLDRDDLHRRSFGYDRNDFLRRGY